MANGRFSLDEIKAEYDRVRNLAEVYRLIHNLMTQEARLVDRLLPRAEAEVCGLRVDCHFEDYDSMRIEVVVDPDVPLGEIVRVEIA